MMEAVFVSTLLLLCTVTIASSNRPETNIFSLMYFFGHQNRGSNKQFLVVTMLTPEEFKDSEKWTDLSYLTSHTNGNRIKFYLNEPGEDELPETGTTTKHGEIIFLYLDDNAPETLEAMLPDYSEGELPYLIFYSFYIPCACVEGCDFSCAEELGHAAKRYKNKYKFIVAYSKTFVGRNIGGTDEARAEDFMKAGGIQIYKYIHQSISYEPLQLVPYIETTARRSEVFQNNLRDLLVQSPVAGCTSTDGNYRKLIAVSFINEATKPCFQETPRKYFGGLTELNTAYLYNCLQEYIYSAVENHCDRLPRSLRDIRMMFTTAINSALAQSKRIGYPTMQGADDYRPVEDNMLWQNLYIQTGPQEQLACQIKPDLTVESFCTKKRKRNKVARNEDAFGGSVLKKRPGPALDSTEWGQLKRTKTQD